MLNKYKHAFNVYSIRPQSLQNGLTIWTIFLLFNGQGFRNLVGILSYALICVMTVILMISYMNHSKPAPKNSYILLTFLVTTGLTVIWSSYSALSLLGWLVTALTSLLAALVAMTYSWNAFKRLFECALKASIICSLVFEMIVSFIIRAPLLPFYTEFYEFAGIDQDTQEHIYWSDNNLLAGGPLQGFQGNRNLFGFLALLLFILILYKFFDKSLQNVSMKIENGLWLLLTLCVQSLTESATMTFAYAAVIILLVVSLLIRITPKKYKKIVSYSLIGAIGVIGIYAVKYYEFLFSLVDRKPDFTERLPIWNQVIERALQRPEGWGWVGYWPVWEEPYRDIFKDRGYAAQHAHNAFLDIWLQGGVLSVVVIILVFIFIMGNLWRVVSYGSKTKTWNSVILLSLTSALFIQSLTESRLLIEGNWFLLCVILLYTPSAFIKRPVEEQEEALDHF